MTTGANVDISGWFIQSATPIRDGNYPLTERPSGSVFYFGYEHISTTSITPSITVADTSTIAPMAVMATGSGTTSVATRTKTSESVNDYQDLDYVWEITHQGGAAIEDLEGIVDPRDSSAVNPYTDQVSPEFTCMLREPGTYTLTLTVRGMSAVSGTVIEASTSTNITVTAATATKNWIDATNGNDANDGLDPWGFALTTASYTHSTRELTQTGAFASYTHDVSVPYTFRDNWIYINKAGFEGLYEIESKTSNDTIVLVSGLGSDQTNVTSSDGPTATFDGSQFASGTEIMLADTADYDISSTINGVTSASPPALTGYRGTPKLWTDSGTQLVSIFLNTGQSAVSQYRLSNIDLDPQNAQPTSGAGSMDGLFISTTDSGTKTFIFDNLTAQNGNAQDEIGWNPASGASTSKVHSIFYNCYVDGRYGTTGRGSSQHGVITGTGRNDAWLRIFGNTIDNDADSNVSNHFWYVANQHENTHIAYNHTRNGSNNAYAFNIDRDTGTGNYYSVVNNNFGPNSVWGLDWSTASNDFNGGKFTNALISNNLCNSANGFMFHYTLIDGRVAYNQYYNSAAGFAFYTSALPLNPDFTNYKRVIDRNEVYSDEDFTNDARAYPQEYQDNTHYRTTDGVVFTYLDASVTKTLYDVDENNFYCPARVSGLICNDGVGDISIATLNTNFSSATNTSSDPGWPDPANGNFGGVPTGIEVTV